MELGLGTVQFGLDYGVSNARGPVPPDEARRIVETAGDAGIRLIDTAAGYGDCETALGRILPPGHRFGIVTKLPGVQGGAITGRDIDRLETTFSESLSKLSTDHVHGLLLHRPMNLFLEGGGRLYDLLTGLKRGGRVEKIGVSVYGGSEIDALFSRFAFDIVQLPVSVLDQRLAASGHITALHERGVEVHARSVFLQGLLLMNPDDVDGFFAPILPLLRRYRDTLAERGLTPEEGAFGFVRSVQGIDAVVVGVTTVDELRRDIAAFGRAVDTALDYSPFAVDDPAMVNPGMWRLET